MTQYSFSFPVFRIFEQHFRLRSGNSAAQTRGKSNRNLEFPLSHLMISIYLATFHLFSGKNWRFLFTLQRKWHRFFSQYEKYRRRRFHNTKMYLSLLHIRFRRTQYHFLLRFSAQFRRYELRTTKRFSRHLAWFYIQYFSYQNWQGFLGLFFSSAPLSSHWTELKSLK